MKHLLNDLSIEEKNRIREQHEGGMTIDTSKFKQLTESKLGEVKLIELNEEESQFMDSDKTDLKLLVDYLTIKNGFEYLGNKDGVEIYILKKGGYSISVGIKPSDEPFFVDLRVWVSSPMGKMINYLKEVKGVTMMKVRMNDYDKILQVLQGASDFGKAQSDYDNLEPLPKF